jgi:hypothetical protein
MILQWRFSFRFVIFDIQWQFYWKLIFWDEMMISLFVIPYRYRASSVSLT